MHPSPDRVVILSDFAAVRGGASKLAVLQASLMAEAGLPVTVFAGDDGSDLPSSVEIVSLGGRRLTDQGKLAAAVGGLWNAEAARQLTRWIAENDSARTIYHVHGYHQTLSPSVLAPLARVRKRVVMHAHDFFLACPNGGFFDFRSRTPCDRRALSVSCITHNCDKRSYGQKLWRVTRQALQNGARYRLLPDVTTILINPGMEEWLFPGGTSGKLVSVPNPAQALCPEPVDSARNQSILYVGDMHLYKGVWELAEAGRRAGVQIRFVGDGIARPKMEQDYPEHLYEGWQDREGLQRLTMQARFLVAPSLGPEPYGLATVESVLSGVPVLISDTMLLSRQIEDAGMGQRVAVQDIDALAESLRRLSQDDAEIQAMSQAALRNAHELTLSPEHWRDALLGTYADVLTPTDLPEVTVGTTA